MCFDFPSHLSAWTSRVRSQMPAPGGRGEDSRRFGVSSRQKNAFGSAGKKPRPAGAGLKWRPVAGPPGRRFLTITARFPPDYWTGGKIGYQRGGNNLYAGIGASIPALAVFWCELQLVSHACEFGQGLGPHLLHDLATVDLHGNLAHTEVAGDLLVQPSSHD
jgi:hypothetical protein